MCYRAIKNINAHFNVIKKLMACVLYKHVIIYAFRSLHKPA